MFQTSALRLFLAATALVIAGPASAATFFTVSSSEASDGKFGWDTFSGAAAGPHTAHTSTGTGAATLSATPGGILTGGGNLYSMFTNPTWTLSLTGLAATETLTTIALQIAATTGANATGLVASNFTIGGITPTIFQNTGSAVDAGNTFQYYWATWENLAAASSYTIAVNATASGNHTSLDGASVEYFNSASSNLGVIPEPGSVLLGAAGLLALCGRRRR